MTNHAKTLASKINDRSALVGVIGLGYVGLPLALAFTEKGFTQVPNAVLRAKKLSMGAKMAYAALLSYAWNEDYCFPGQQRLADDIGVSRQTANEYIQELKRKGYVNIVRKGQGRPNLYELKVSRH